MLVRDLAIKLRDLLSPLLLTLFSVRETTVRFDCHPEPGATREACEARGCLWGSPHANGAPWCYMREGIGYTLAETKGPLTILNKNDGPQNPWGEDIRKVHFETSRLGDILNVKIFVPGRYDPPVNLLREPPESTDSLKVKTTTENNVFSFAVYRESTQLPIFDTSIGGMIFSDKFIQLATYLPSDAMYGIGENVHSTLKHDFTNYRTWALFARDEFPISAFFRPINLYGMHPFYLILEKDGKAHGVFILNSNAQEFTTAPGPALIYRTIGGNLDLYFFPGPSPENVIEQYQALIGRPIVPAYWAFGFQLSRYGYKDLEEMIEKVRRNIEVGVPIETTVCDIEYMDRYKDFTIGKGWEELPTYVEELHKKGMRAILIWDPAIQVDYDVFERALQLNARFIEWERKDQVMQCIQDLYPLVADTKIMLGVVWPDRHAAFPDFLDRNTRKWWIEEFIRMYNKVQFDGVWIDMNEPANFGTNEAKPWYFDNPDHPNISTLYCPLEGPDSSWDMPPYQTHGVWLFGNNSFLAQKTLSLYAATSKRGVIVSRSTFASAGRYAGHWLGDNAAQWEDLQTSVIGVQEFNLFGIPYVGSDICGFFSSPSEELCLRWHQVGAFHPFMRNHNCKGAPPQDPAEWKSVAEAARKAILFRYKYLPYLYSLHFTVSVKGGTVIRPVFFEFPLDKETHNLGHQFMWGRSMMIVPVLKKGAVNVDAYFPQEEWYFLYSKEYGKLISPGYNTVRASLRSLTPVFVRGGNILPRQDPAMTTAASRKNPFELLIVPRYSQGIGGYADGFLYWDDGESIIQSVVTHNFYEWSFKFYCDMKQATLFIETRRHATNLTIPTLDKLEILGYKYKPDFDSFALNGINVDVEHSLSKDGILEISRKDMIDISTGKTYNLMWTHYFETLKE
ncbi:hypothetical protein RB195_017733 [Necator americanus]|uniref:Maltase n=1 Tax=Necator americanus TaxID=51031 RepID=A0ABR1C6I2_NECAM